MTAPTTLSEAQTIDWFRIDLAQFAERYTAFLRATEALSLTRRALALCRVRECGHDLHKKSDGTADRKKWST